MDSVRVKMSGRARTRVRTWALLAGAIGAVACGVDDVDTVDDINHFQTGEPGTTEFSAADCAAAAIDAYGVPDPNFSVTSPETYNACGAAYTVDLGAGGRPGLIGGSGGATFHHDLLVSYAGPAATTPAACHALYGAAYFYDHPAGAGYQNIGLKASPGWWVHGSAACVSPQVSVRDFDRYLDPSVSTDVKVAAAMRDSGQRPLPLKVSAVQYSVDTPTGCSGGVALLLPDQGLFTGQSMSSCDGRFRLSMQDDGNLVLSQKDDSGAYTVVLWSSETSGVPAANMVKLQSIGTLVISALDGTTIWTSNAISFPGQHLELGDDGNMKIMDAVHVPGFVSNTGGH